MWGHRMYDRDLGAAVEDDFKVSYCSDRSDFPKLTYSAENLKNENLTGECNRRGPIYC